MRVGLQKLLWKKGSKKLTNGSFKTKRHLNKLKFNSPILNSIFITGSKQIAVLLTCFNRKEKTKNCLENLFQQQLPEGYALEVFVCDDNSSDGTLEMLKSEFPAVHVVSGDGSLFWGGGMRKAWELAANTSDFDYFLWLNDDTFIHPKGLFSLLIEAEELPSKGILSAACRKPGTQEFSYGGLDNFGGIVPNGSIQKVLYINGNLVLIPREVYQKIGAISPKYTHYLGDYDYGLRAQKAGFDCFTTSAYLAECDVNDIPYWGDPELKLKERWNMAHDIKGLAISEYISYKKYHFGKWVGFKTWIDSYLKVLSPQLYIQIRNFFKRALNPN